MQSEPDLKIDYFLGTSKIPKWEVWGGKNLNFLYSR